METEVSPFLGTATYKRNELNRGLPEITQTRL